jgi:hypothetical protein
MLDSSGNVRDSSDRDCMLGEVQTNNQDCSNQIATQQRDRILSRRYASQVSSVLTDMSVTLDQDAFAYSLNCRAVNSIKSQSKKYNISPK